MFRVLLKDLRISFKALFVTLIIGITFSAVSVNIPYRAITEIMYILLIFIMVYIVVFNNEARNARCNNEMVMLSLPVTRNQYVLAKYLGVVAYFLIGSLCIGIGFNVLALLFGKAPIFISIYSMMFALGFILILFSVYLPLMFAIGFEQMRIFSTLIYMGIMVVPFLVGKTLSKTFSQDQMYSLMSDIGNLIPLMFLILALVMYIISFGISKKCYRDL